MLISQELRKTNIAEYLLYMWQVEDIIRAYGCNLSAIKRDYISRFELDDEQREDVIDWYGNLIRMIREEGCTASGHIQINKIIIQQLTELHNALLSSSKFPFYSAEYYKVLPFIVELRQRNKQASGNDSAPAEEVGEIETCFNALYGTMLLRLQKKDITPQTKNAVTEITTFIGMLNDYYFKEKEDPKFWGEE